jgi:hypothetical protein
MKNKNLLVVLLVLLTIHNAFSQPLIKDQRVAGGNSDDYLNCMDTTSDGGFIVGGSSPSGISGQKTDTSRGQFFSDFWIIKYDHSGRIEWDKTIGGSLNDGCTAIQQTSDGGYIAGGWSSSNRSGEKSEDSRGSTDYWVVKLDHEGNVQWDKTIGGNDFDDLYALQQTSDGGYILGGNSASNKSGEKSENLRGSNLATWDYWIVRLDRNGNIQWDKTIGGDQYDNFSDLKQTGDGGYIIGGYSNSDSSFEKTKTSFVKCSGFPPRCYVTEDYWIVKLNKNGKIQWDKSIGGSDADELYTLQQTNDNGYILGGASSSNKSGDKSENSRTFLSYGLADYWVVKLDSSGNKQWDKTIGGYEYDYLKSLQQTKDNGYILGGYSNSDTGAEKSEHVRGAQDYWVVKINDKGKVKWDKTIGGNGYDVLTKIVESHKNTFLVGGYSDSHISGDKTKATRGGVDYWIVKLRYNKLGDTSIISSTNNDLQITKSGDNKFSVYPNPARNILYVSIIGSSTFSLTDQSGKILITKIIRGNGEINISKLTGGLYYLKNNSTGAVQKVVITK